MKYCGKMLVLAGLLVGATGCMSTLTGESYSRDEARRAQTVEYGMVEYVRPVVIEGTKSGVGPAAGAAVGGIAGSTVGHGRGSVRMDNGRIISVVQQVSGSASFHAGDRVRILTLGGTTRIAQ